MAKSLSNDPSGFELLSWITSGYMDDLVPGLVAASPNDAIDKIERASGRRLTRSGFGLRGIDTIRQKLFDFHLEAGVENALLIVAPHTHWGDNLPIIIRWTDDRYIIGPTEPDPSMIYRPVSFVFSTSGPLAYEWVDTSVIIDENERSLAQVAINMINEAVHPLNLPLGLSLNFRFKSLFANTIIPNVEQPLDVDGDESHSEIIKVHTYMSQHELATFRQVAWHCHSDSQYNLSPEEQNLINTIRQYADLTDQNEKDKLSKLMLMANN